jgi:hypothetical protein
MATQQRSKTKKFLVHWKGGGADELFGYSIEDALKREGILGGKSAMEYSEEIPMTPEEEAEYAFSDDWEDYFEED